MPNKRFGAFLSSSQDPQKIALTVTGFLVSISSLIVYFAGKLGFMVTVEQVTSYAGLLGTTIGAIITLTGLFRKIFVVLFEKTVAAPLKV